ncbi:MAG: hypothetical protein ABSG49_09105 [Methanoregula sp.]|jgi:hypothetical protein|uniref:hypothetical protein n=1 Tax=Methanoregula sp. TaxID=2052170 RepID=UPI003C137C6C
MAAATYVIKQFGIVSVGKFFAILGIIWGFIMGIFVAAGVGSMGYLMGTQALGIVGGLVALVFMIIIGGVFGFIGGVIVSVVYNIVLGASGGVEMDLEVKG